MKKKILIKFNKKGGRRKYRLYDICVVYKGMKPKTFVLQKLGSFNPNMIVRRSKFKLFINKLNIYEVNGY